MVTNFDPSPLITKPSIAMHIKNTNVTPAFPLSSPPAEHLTSFKPSNSEAALSSGNPFLSTNSFASGSSDDESGSSSGRDEFQLERYSHASTTPRSAQRTSRKQSLREKSAKRKRPGLNIVTDFSGSPKRSHTDGLVIDQVQAQRPRMKPRYPTSIASAKAEHVRQSVDYTLQNGLPFDKKDAQQQIDTLNTVIKTDKSKRALGREALSRLQELQAARRKGFKNNQNQRDGPSKPHQLEVSQKLEPKHTDKNAYSPESRSIVIGLSVPEDEAEAHKFSNGGDSALSMHTPDTPAIVVTPADATDDWRILPQASKARPASSIYSATPWNERSTSQDDLPPVPKIPPSHSDNITAAEMATGARITHQMVPRDRERDANYADDDDDDEDDAMARKRTSSESQEHILASRSESRRHKSQGWWNLMLSPMLSRKGTLKSIHTVDQATPPMPSMPNLAEVSKGNINSPLSSQSPGTPRRLGLASARASIWSRWTTWENERDGKQRSGEKTEISPDTIEKEPIADDSDMIQWSNTFMDSGKGLAAEYFHACAVEQVKGIKYFDCENHSCAEQLPKLHSIFDDAAVGVASVESGNATRAVPEPLGDEKADDARAERTLSKITIRTEPEELSPNVRQANTAAVVQAKSIDSLAKPEEAQAKSVSESTRDLPGEATTDLSPKRPVALERSTSRRGVEYPNIATVVPASAVAPPVPSPGPISPGMQQKLAPKGAVPMAEMISPSNETRSLEQTRSESQSAPWPQAQPTSFTIHNHTTYTERMVNQSPFMSEMEGTEEASPPPRQQLQQPAAKTIVQESTPAPLIKEDAPQTKNEEKPDKKRLLSKLKCFRSKSKPTAGEDTKKKKHRWTWLIGIALFLIVIACILLATLLTRSGDGTPVQSQWLNLTGYPPIPTGISTIARPDAVKQQSQCVGPTTLWSCALPKENQAEIAPNSPDQPNFRFQISFKNGTVPANMTIPVESLSKRSMRLTARADDPFTNDLFEPNPAPPSRADQLFMGNTTDNITEPFDGEKTPFFITFIPVFPIDPSNITVPTSTSSRLRRRQDNSSTDSVPAPDVLDDGSAAPANLLPTAPYPTSQPVKLYNRGLDDEHYGFYMYYDKSIFLRTEAPFKGLSATGNNGIDPADENGGSTRDEATIRCTFSQTRFLVRIWTNPAFGATLLPPTADVNTTNENVNSATDFSRPGSFPYPTTISLDRHGGNVNKKAAYCYGVDDLQVIQDDVKTLIPELRGDGGRLINPAPRLVNGTGLDDGFDQNAGGIDGGTGGCECVWQNWN